MKFRRPQIFANFYELLLKDLVRIYALLDKRMRTAILVLGGLMMCQAMMELLTIEGIRQLGLATSNPESLQYQHPWLELFGVMPGFGEWAAASSVHYLFLAACFVVVLIGVKNAITWVVMWRTGRDSELISQQIAMEIMRRYLYEEYSWHLSSAGNDAMHMMLNRQQLASLLVQQITALTGFLACAVLFCALLVQEPILCLAIICFVGVVAFFTYAFLRMRIDRSGTEAAAVAAEEHQTFTAATRGVREVLIYGQQEAFLRELKGTLQRGMSPRVFLYFASSIPSNILEVAGFAMIPAVILVMGSVGASLPTILSAVLLMVLTAWRVLPYLNRGVGQMVSIRGLRPQALPVLNFLYSLRENPLSDRVDETDRREFSKFLALKNVSFHYPASEAPSISDITLTIPKGSLVGIIGPSGAGKSTLCLLLSGLCWPESGEVIVDGRPLTRDEMKIFRKRVSFVPQAPFLMHGSLAANIAFSEWGKAWDDDEVIRACREASIDFVPHDPQGVLYQIWENGAGLSGGQAQRVAIARALYANPEILVFDEATSALDAGNENCIMATIEALRGKATCIVIAHRLSTVEHCDIIYWIDNGRVVAQGSPEEILPAYSASFAGAGSAPQP